jgi:hypothetical protein
MDFESFNYAWCYQWNGLLLGILAITDALIWVAYLAIPAVIYKHRLTDDLPRWVTWAFILFIAFCGAGHFCDVLNRFWPIYWVKAGSNLLTAAASIGTVAALYLHNEWLERPSRKQLEQWLSELRAMEEAAKQAESPKFENALSAMIARLDQYDREIQAAMSLKKEFLK